MNSPANQPLSKGLLSQLSKFIARRTALHFPPKRWGDLQRKLAPAAKEFGFSDPAAFVKWLLSSPLTSGQMESLASHLTISETYFWREPQAFEALESEILPELIAQRQGGVKRLNLWSAGCASGEEPYSLAMALRRSLPHRDGWHLKLLGTDINPRALRQARKGVYGHWSFRNAPDWLQQDYFLPQPEGKYRIRPQIQDMVSFAYLNLAEDIYPSSLNHTTAMDVIFCRNVLMYFSPEATRRVIANLRRCLVEGGCLVVSATELSQRNFARFTATQIAGATLYRKERKATRRAKAQTPPPSEPVFSPEPPPPAAPPPEPESRRPAKAAKAKADRAPQSPAPVSTAREIRALADQGELDRALALCQEALAADKLDAGMHYLQAAILQEQERIDEAVRSLRRALYLEPNLLMAHFALGNLMLRQGRRREAKRSFANVLGLLEERPQDEPLPQVEGLTAGRFREITLATIQAGGLA